MNLIGWAKEMRDEVSAIKGIRAHNNDFWMSILNLAIEHAPREKVLPLLRSIYLCDTDIKNRFAELIVNLESEDGDG